VTVSRLTSAGSKPRARADTRDESGTEMAAKHDGGFVGGKEDTTFEICGASDGHGYSEACAVGQMSAVGTPRRVLGRTRGFLAAFLSSRSSDRPPPTKSDGTRHFLLRKCIEPSIFG
jgi:hypothetical protein